MTKAYYSDQMRYIPVITTEHQRIHEGDMYMLNKAYTTLGTTDKYFYVKPGTYNMHLSVLTGEIETGDLRLELYEAPTIVSNSAPATLINLNRVSTKTTDAIIYETVAASSNGTFLMSIGVFAAGGAGPGVLVSKAAYEIILNKANTYLLRTNIQNAVGDFVLNAIFYEPR